MSKFPWKSRVHRSTFTNRDCRLITEWRIQKRVDEQFNAFVQGFHELIPADLVNVFDERELELLIGGIADIDVDDWKKHTDYRGYTESDPVVQNFWKVSNESSTQPSSSHGDANKCNHRSFAAGTPSRSLVSSNSPPVPHVFPSTVSRICKVPTALVASPSKSQARRHSFPSRTRASTVLTCRLTRPMTRSRRNSRGLSRRLLVSDRSKRYADGGGRGKVACVPFVDHCVIVHEALRVRTLGKYEKTQRKTNRMEKLTGNTHLSLVSHFSFLSFYSFLHHLSLAC